MAKSELKVEVSANLAVSDEMADRCLALLEWWQNDHNEQRLMATTNADGSIHLYREKKESAPYSLRYLGNGIYEEVERAVLDEQVAKKRSTQKEI